MKAVLIFLVIPAVCLASTCQFLSGTNNTCMTSNNGGGCASCISGYGLYNGLCYPPCPSGWTELMPGYCINSTILEDHKNFTLCPTNETMYMSGPGGQYVCLTQNTGGCQCAPECPAGYTPSSCQCLYIKNIESIASEVDHYHSWLYAFSAIGLFAILLAAGYLVKKYLVSNEVKIPLQSQAAIHSRYASIVEAQ